MLSREVVSSSSSSSTTVTRLGSGETMMRVRCDGAWYACESTYFVVWMRSYLGYWVSQIGSLGRLP